MTVLLAKVCGLNVLLMTEVSIVGKCWQPTIMMFSVSMMQNSVTNGISPLAMSLTCPMLFSSITVITTVIIMFMMRPIAGRTSPRSSLQVTRVELTVAMTAPIRAVPLALKIASMLNSEQSIVRNRYWSLRLPPTQHTGLFISLLPPPCLWKRMVSAILENPAYTFSRVEYYT